MMLILVDSLSVHAWCWVTRWLTCCNKLAAERAARVEAETGTGGVIWTVWTPGGGLNGGPRLQGSAVWLFLV